MKLIYPLFLLLVVGITFAVTEQDCWNQARPCAKACCPSMGGTWSDVEDDCMIDSSYSDAETAQLMQQNCPNCYNTFMDCIASVQSTNQTTIIPPLDPSSPSAKYNPCCGVSFVLGFISLGAFLVKN